MQASSRVASQLFTSGSVTLRAVSRQRIQELNRAFLHHDYCTDVLAFPACADDARAHIGDIALCWDEVIAQAARNGNSVEAEALALAVHALLHLAGWDHDTEPRREAMDRRTVELCKLAGISVSGFGYQ